jgi:hypothetical protein
MILRYAQLVARPKVFTSMTGLAPATFDEIAAELAPRLTAARSARRDRPGRRRAPGAGHPFELHPRDALLLTIVWLRHYPTCEVLGYLFGASAATASRMIREALPLLEAAGRDTMRLPDPGRLHRRHLGEVLRRIPGLGALLEAGAAATPRHSDAGPRRPTAFVDSFEQAVQRPRDRAEAKRWYSGKKKMHTIKTQVAVDGRGRIIAICGDAVGPFSDLTLLAASGLARRLDPDVELGGDGAYLGMAEFRRGGLTRVPRRGTTKRPLTDEDRAFNRELSRCRIVVEHAIGRLRSYRSLADRDRHHRRGHERRVIAVAGLINRRAESRVAI